MFTPAGFTPHKEILDYRRGSGIPPRDASRSDPIGTSARRLPLTSPDVEPSASVLGGEH
jgi:hypothetical protein